MYHPEIVTRRVASQQKTLRSAISGFEVRECTRAESAEFAASLANRQGTDLTQQEQIFVLSELALCKASFVYWAERYGKIKTAAMKVEACPLLPAQKVTVAKMGDIELAIANGTHQEGLLVQVLKSRQQGITTLFAMIEAHRAFFYGNCLALIASDEEEHSAYVFDMLERVHANLPWWMQPVKTYHEKDYELYFGEIDALIRLDWANNKRGAVGEGNLGRGMTPNMFHGSEISSWTEAQTDQIDYSLLPGMHPLPTTMGVLESTPKGEGNYFHRTWEQTVAGEKRWSPIFTGWYIDPKLRTRTPEGWVPQELTLAHAEKVKRSSTKWAGYEVVLNPEQMYWWERNYMDAKKNNKAQRFFSEYAADPETCFASSSDSVFPAEVIASLYQTARPLITVLGV